MKLLIIDFFKIGNLFSKTQLLLKTGIKLFLKTKRAAMKMANLDAVFDFMFTDPKDEEGVRIFLKNKNDGGIHEKFKF